MRFGTCETSVGIWGRYGGCSFCSGARSRRSDQLHGHARRARECL